MRRIARLFLLAPVSLALAFVACENTANFTAPSDQPTAQFAAKNSPKRALAVVAGGHGEAILDARGGTIVVEGDDPADIIAILEVPAGTVRKNTTFTIDISDDYLVELTATSDHSLETNDVGHTGFKKGILLYFNRSHILDTGNLGVAEVKTNGQLLIVDSFHDGMWLVGILKHFSGYSPISD